ncbi:hypothetical protein AQJ84_06825 [Streptomyces resistomycificus]|uniref:Uncharacterized protein n=1 Tax=Streptomyces resistomycificus TaxID=67356 RepID=A0A0L8L931_9ACTN|nr:hypothetical protein ADK37_18375 [Streptomyces resistomycificus]KUO01005.1 hypothetical protein AQJ84_06825 [Streptomyces resistomycificus]
MHFRTLEEKLRERHPELGDRIQLGDIEGRDYLKVDLTGHQSVVLFLCRFGHADVWAIEDPDLDSPPSVWPLTTPADALVDAVHAVASAHLAGVPLPSPWRWHESEPSEVTELADLLVARDVRVLRVAAGNRYFPYGTRHAPKLDTVGGGWSKAVLEAELPDAYVRVALKPSLGWTVDAHSPLWDGWSRIDLGWCLRGRSSPVPGMPNTRVSLTEIAELLCRGRRTWDIESAWKPPRPSSPPAPTSAPTPQDALFPDALEDECVPGWFAGFRELWATAEGPEKRGGIGTLSASEVVEAVLEQLSDLGFADLREGVDPDEPIQSDFFHIAWHSGRKSLSTSAVHKMNSLAAASGEDAPKRLIVITGTGLTRPAADVANQAKAFAFYLDRETGELSAQHSRTHEALLPVRQPVRRELEPW